MLYPLLFTQMGLAYTDDGNSQYLLRAEQNYPWYYANETRMFINCAHIEVVGPGGGTPGPFAKLPYKAEDPVMSCSMDMYRYISINPEYKVPGPPVWTG